MTMRVSALLLCILIACEARAQTCQELYESIRQEAMYCGFFCDWQSIRKLQVIYEGQCMPRSIPLSMFDRDQLTDDSTGDLRGEDGRLGRRSEATSRGRS